MELDKVRQGLGWLSGGSFRFWECWFRVEDVYEEVAVFDAHHDWMLFRRKDKISTHKGKRPMLSDICLALVETSERLGSGMALDSY